MATGFDPKARRRELFAQHQSAAEDDGLPETRRATSRVVQRQRVVHHVFRLDLRPEVHASRHERETGKMVRSNSFRFYVGQ